MQAKDGGDAHCGRKLKRMVAEAGLEPLYSGYRYDANLISPTVGADFLAKHVKESLEKEGALEKGWTTKEEADAMLSGLEAFKADPDAVFVVSFGEVAGRKPV